MPVGISLQKYALDLDNLQNISQIVLQGRDASCGLLLALVTVLVPQKPHYGLKNLQASQMCDKRRWNLKGDVGGNRVDNACIFKVLSES